MATPALSAMVEHFLDLLISAGEAVIATDSRYYEQSAQQAPVPVDVGPFSGVSAANGLVVLAVVLRKPDENVEAAVAVDQGADHLAGQRGGGLVDGADFERA